MISIDKTFKIIVIFAKYFERKWDVELFRQLTIGIFDFVADDPWRFNFEVKFYPPDPSQLQEDITR